MGQAAAGAAMSPLRKASEAMKTSRQQGARNAINAMGGTITGGAPSGGPAQSPNTTNPSSQPEWAAAMKQRQTISHAASIAAHTLRSGDGGGAGTSINITPKD